MAQHHVVLAGRIGIDETRAGIARGERPRHFMLHVADLLGAEIHEPPLEGRPLRRRAADRLAGIAPPCAALADQVVETAGPDDVIFCNSEAVSLAIAARLRRLRKATRLASLVHNLIRPRTIAAQSLFGLIERHDALFSVSRRHAEALRTLLGRNGGKSVFVEEQIDDAFFTPGSPARGEGPPVVVSVGMEQRDYATLAEAVHGLAAATRISAFSRDARATARSFPADMPPNVDMRHYDWRGLVQLYRDATIVVVPLLPNRYAAGMTSILEAMAVGKPVIVTQTEGLAGAFAKADAFHTVPAGDAAALRAAIERLLADADERDALARRGAALFAARHREDLKAEEMARRLEALP